MFDVVVTRHAGASWAGGVSSRPSRPARRCPEGTAVAEVEPLPLCPRPGAGWPSARRPGPCSPAPDHWTDGCPVLVERRPEGGPEVVTRSYLDPQSGAVLYAEMALGGAPRGFAVCPDHHRPSH